MNPHLSSFKCIKEFGGSLNKKSHAKLSRPISAKYPIHLVLKSSVARGDQSMRSLRNLKTVERIVRRQAQKFRLQILEYSNEGQSLQVMGKVKSRDSYSSFIRATTGLIARQCLGAEKGKSKKIKFWDFRPYSRLVEWVRGYKVAQDEPLQAHLQALGMIPTAPFKWKWSSA